MKKLLLAVYCILSMILICFLASQIPKSKSIDFDLSRFGIAEGYPVSYSQGDLVLSQGTDLSGFFLNSHLIVLPAGDYSFQITYYSDSVNKVHFQANNDIFVESELPAGQNTIVMPITLTESTINGKLRFTYNGAGSFELQNITCSSGRILYSDYIFYLILVVSFNIIVFVMYTQRVRWNITRECVNHLVFIIIVTVLSIPFYALYHNGLYLATDMVFHLSRIDGIKDGLLERQFPVIIYPNMCNEYGSIGTAYPSTFLYFLAILRMFNISPVCVYKFGTILINFFMNLSVFCSVKYISKSNKTAVVATILFAFSYYHLDMVGYKNWTMGMGIATIFIFIVISGLYNILVMDQKKWYLLAIGMTGIISSHIMLSLFVGVLVLLVCLVFTKELFGKKRVVSLIKAILAALAMNLCTIAMFFDAMSNKLNTGRLQWTSFGENTYDLYGIISNPMNLCTSLLLLVMLYYLVKKRKERNDEYRFILCLWGLDVFLFILTTDIIPWKSILEFSWANLVMSYIQFPLRLYAIIAPTTAICTAVCIYRLQLSKTIRKVVFVLFAVTAIGNYYNVCVEYQGAVVAIADHILGDIFSTHSSDDYLPEGADYEWYNNPYPDFSLYDDSIIVNNYTKSGTRVYGEYISSKEDQYLDMPLFYYKGYQCVDAEGHTVGLSSGNHRKIRLALQKTDQPISFTIYYSVPVVFKVLFIFSLFSSVMIVFCFVRSMGLWKVSKK